MSSSLARLEERIEALEEAAESIREETRRAHEATKRLREIRNEIKYLLDKDIKDIIQESISEQVRKGLEDYDENIRIQIDKATQKVFKRFDDIFKTLTTGKPSGDGPVFGNENWRLKK